MIKFHCFSKTIKTSFPSPKHKGRAENKSVFSNYTIPKGNTLSLISSMTNFLYRVTLFTEERDNID